MNSLLILVLFLSLVSYCHSVQIDNLFDINDVENEACQGSCDTENVRDSSVERTYKKLYKCSECSKLFELCIKYRTCQDHCVPEMPVLPYKQAKDLAERVRPPINPCLDLVSACNFESMDSYEILRSENPFLFV